MSIELLNAVVMAAYAQVALVDAEDTDSYPEWEQATLHGFVAGPRGVAVAAAIDAEVWVRVLGGWEGNELVEGHLFTSAEIMVGNQGVIAGNLTTQFARLWWPSGPTRVTVYVNAPPEEVTAVTFVLEQI